MSAAPSLGTIDIDLPRLLETRMLIQSNSGGGKSRTLRRILEQTAPHVQQFVIDPEGEFATLRERHDFIVCAPRGADAVANPQTAAALALALWGARTSAILDIYELKAHDRILFVRRFLEALTNAPRALWSPALVVIDEAHIFAPQGDRAESLSAVIDLATRGRKRGLALLAATQRISKLHKDVAAELLNKLIGRTGLDVDIRRAADELGMNVREATETLRNLEPGEFFVYGPALTRSVERTRIGKVATTHPETGKRALVAPPPPSPKVLAQLAKIEGLQRKAEEEVKTVASLSADLASVRRELTLARKAAPQWDEADIQRRVEAGVTRALSLLPPPREPIDLSPVRDLLERAADWLTDLQAKEWKAKPTQPRTPRAAAPAQPAPVAPRSPAPTAEGVTAPQQRILNALAQLDAFDVPAPQKGMVAAHAGASPKSSGFANNLGSMRSKGLIDYPSPGCISLTAAGRSIANRPDKAPTLAELHASWMRVVTRPQQAILDPLIACYPEALAKGELAERAGVSVASSGFANNLGALRSLGVLDYPQPGHIAATTLLFPKGKP